MGDPGWWEQRRFGIFVHASLASVPAWSPIGEYAEWYPSHLGEPVADVLLHPHPMVEVMAHHRERWGHLATYDDFWPLLTFDRFDPDALADLIAGAGAGYAVLVAKHHDGLCWWDAPSTRRTVLTDGPRRDVLGETATALTRRDVVLGTYYSLLDWADPRYPTDAYVDEVLHPHVVDLVERFGSQVLWGDGHWGHGPDRWRTTPLLDRLRRDHPGLVVNDRWWHPDPDVVTFEYQTPSALPDRPWELCRGIGHSFGHNTAEPAEHHLTGAQIVALLTEVVAKGGHLLLNLGLAADGTVPELQAAPLRDAGRWITRHQALVDRGRPWTTWGDTHVRYLVLDGVLHAIDLSGRGVLPGIGATVGRVSDVSTFEGAPLRFEQTDVLRVRAPDRPPGEAPLVYRIELHEPASIPIALFEPEPARPIPLAPLLEDARPGDVILLGAGSYEGPVTVPDGVTLRGVGPDRTIVRSHGQGPAIALGHRSRLEHLRVDLAAARVAWLPMVAVACAGAGAVVAGSVVTGTIGVTADDVRLAAVQAWGVTATDVERLSIVRSAFEGMRWDVGIDVRGGAGHLIDSCELTGHLCAVHLTATVSATVRRCSIAARWWGVRLTDTETTSVSATVVRGTMRAVDVDGGTTIDVIGNAAIDGDSGLLVQRGAHGVHARGNYWERCRVGLFTWESPDVHHHDNAAVDLWEPEAAAVIGPV